MLPDLQPCRKCGNLPHEELQYSGSPFVAYKCCELSTRRYKSRQTAREVWNRWQTKKGLQSVPTGGPQGLGAQKIGYDIDGVLCHFKRGMLEEARKMGYGQKVPDHPMEWDEYNPEWDEGILDEVWDRVGDNHTWWARLNPYDDAHIFTDVECYITSRSVPSQLTEQWLIGHGFPKAPVTSVGHGNSKLPVAQQADLDLFIDDKPETVRELNRNGIPALLRDRAHNWEAGDLDQYRIRSLRQVQKNHV